MAAVTINTLVKGGLAVALGNKQLGRSVGSTLGVAAALAALVWTFI